VNFSASFFTSNPWHLPWKLLNIHLIIEKSDLPGSGKNNCLRFSGQISPSVRVQFRHKFGRNSQNCVPPFSAAKVGTIPMAPSTPQKFRPAQNLEGRKIIFLMEKFHI
jgi:hypothetical protein